SQLPSQEEINQLQQASLVSNTEKNTAKWLRTIERFNKNCGISQAIELIDSVTKLEDYLCQFITWLQKEDGSDYKVESVHNCYSAINRYLRDYSVIQPIKIWDPYRFPRALRTLDGKMRILQDKGLGDPKKSDGLSLEEIKQILDHLYMSINNNESLIRRVFFWLCLLCGLRGGDAYRICRKDLERRQDGGLELVLHKEKNNQGGAFYRNKHGKTNSRRIPIPPDSPNNLYTPIKDILFFLSKLPDSSLLSDPLFHETYKSQKGRWYKNTHMGYTKLRKMMNDIATNTGINLDNGRKITNHSCRRTAIQLLKNNGVSDSELQSFSGHRSREGLADYCQTSEDQHSITIPKNKYPATQKTQDFTTQDSAIQVFTTEETQTSVTKETLLSVIEETPTNKKINPSQVSRIPKPKARTQAHPYSS
ncbi:14482_t:CDS:2, partial [Acaulospora morrowiae]